jgi:hypothetical protein
VEQVIILALPCRKLTDFGSGVVIENPIYDWDGFVLTTVGVAGADGVVTALGATGVVAIDLADVVFVTGLGAGAIFVDIFIIF